MHLLYNNIRQNVVLATLKKRTAAFLIDSFVLFTAIVLLDYYTISSNETTIFFKPEAILYILMGWLYFAGPETCSCRASLGKYLLHVKVKSTDNTRLSFKCATIRYFSKPVSLFVFIFRFVTGTPFDARLPYHDKLANALVIAE